MDSDMSDYFTAQSGSNYSSSDSDVGVMWPVISLQQLAAQLDELSSSNLPAISNRMILWSRMSQSRSEFWGKLIRLIFEEVVDKALRPDLHAQLCCTMMEQMGARALGMKSIGENYLVGEQQQFRTHFLDIFQQVGYTVFAAYAGHACPPNAPPHLDGYFSTDKSRYRCLALTKFLTEAFKVQLMTEDNMHGLIEHLFYTVDSDNLLEHEIESLCVLLKSTGQALDTPNARARMGVYFSIMKELSESISISPRVKFMLQDLVDLRERKWTPRRSSNTLKIASRWDNEPRPPSLYQPIRNQSATPWRGYGGAYSSRGTPYSSRGTAYSSRGTACSSRGIAYSSGSGDNNSGSTPVAFSSGVFSSNKRDDRFWRNFGSRTSPPDVDLALHRKKIILAPRSVPVEDDTRTSLSQHKQDATLDPFALLDSSENDDMFSSPSVSESENSNSISAAAVAGVVLADSNEFFDVRNLDEGEYYFQSLAPEHHFRLVDQLVQTAIYEKDAEARLVSHLFERVVSKKLCSTASFEEGLSPTAMNLQDIIVDAPNAVDLLMTMVKGAGLHREYWQRIVAAHMTSTAFDSTSVEMEKQVAQEFYQDTRNEHFSNVPQILPGAHDLAHISFFAIRVDERSSLVNVLVTEAIQSTNATVQLVAKLFRREALNQHCSPDSFEEGFMPTARTLDDLVGRFGGAYTFMAMMMKGAGLDRDVVRRKRITDVVLDSVRLNQNFDLLDYRETMNC